MSEELKSCPFCGKSDIHIEQKGTFFWCECYDCGAIGRGYYTQPGVNVLQSEDIARGYWNQRPLEDALHTRIAELEAAQRWIPVSERLPEDRATILVAFKNREILTATYYKRYEGFGGVENYWHIEGWHSGNVTHWMPLPEPPNDTQTDTFVYGKESEE